MNRYLARRIGSVLFVLGAVSFGVFLLVRLLPGDPVEVMLGTEAGMAPGIVEDLRRLYGLDRPVLVQYAEWLGQVVRGDLGHSLRSGQPVLAEVLRYLPVTLEIALLAILFAAVVGVPLGIAAAYRRQTWVDFGALGAGLLGLSLPGFWFATLVILVGSRLFGWSPPLSLPPFADDPLAHVGALVLPAVSLGSATAAFVLRMTRSSVLEVLGRDYVRTARSKGASEASVVFRHVLRNALVPIVTVLGFQFGIVLGGSVAIEAIFTLPGIGLMLLNSVLQRDYPMVQGGVLYIALTFVLLNLAVDLLYRYLNPRVELE